MNPLVVIEFFYPEDTPLRRMLLKHSTQVRDKAQQIFDALPPAQKKTIDQELFRSGAMLHDIGIFRCYAPDIFCNGDVPYIAHGLIGGELLRAYGKSHELDMEAFAAICERHTGAGLSAAEIRNQHLPLPERDLLPETPEQELICLADKFYSKSGNMEEKTLPRIRRSMEKFGTDTLARFDLLCEKFEIALYPEFWTTCISGKRELY